MSKITRMSLPLEPPFFADSGLLLTSEILNQWFGYKNQTFQLPRSYEAMWVWVVFSTEDSWLCWTLIKFIFWMDHSSKPLRHFTHCDQWSVLRRKGSTFTNSCETTIVQDERLRVSRKIRNLDPWFCRKVLSGKRPSFDLVFSRRSPSYRIITAAASRGGRSLIIKAMKFGSSSRDWL